MARIVKLRRRFGAYYRAMKESINAFLRHPVRRRKVCNTCHWFKRKLTQVPPRGPFSIRPTETPNSAALRAEAIPPEPPPRTRYWKCFETPTGGILNCFCVFFCWDKTIETWNELSLVGPNFKLQNKRPFHSRNRALNFKN